MTATPEWQRERQRGFARQARTQQCKCGAQVMRGLDADVAAFDVTVDATPIAAEDEQAIIESGRRTYDLCGKCLWRRLDRHVVAGSRYDIHAQHHCERSEQLELIASFEGTLPANAPTIHRVVPDVTEPIEEWEWVQPKGMAPRTRKDPES